MAASKPSYDDFVHSEAVDVDRMHTAFRKACKESEEVDPEPPVPHVHRGCRCPGGHGTPRGGLPPDAHAAPMPKTSPEAESSSTLSDFARVVDYSALMGDKERGRDAFKPRAVAIDASAAIDPRTGEPLKQRCEVWVSVDGHKARALVHDSEVTLINPKFVAKHDMLTSTGPTFTAYSKTHTDKGCTSGTYMDACVTLPGGTKPLVARFVVLAAFDWIDVMLGKDFQRAHRLTVSYPAGGGEVQLVAAKEEQAVPESLLPWRELGQWTELVE